MNVDRSPANIPSLRYLAAAPPRGGRERWLEARRTFRTALLVALMFAGSLRADTIFEAAPQGKRTIADGVMVFYQSGKGNEFDGTIGYFGLIDGKYVMEQEWSGKRLSVKKSTTAERDALDKLWTLSGWSAEVDTGEKYKYHLRNFYVRNGQYAGLADYLFLGTTPVPRRVGFGEIREIRIAPKRDLAAPATITLTDGTVILAPVRGAEDLTLFGRPRFDSYQGVKRDEVKMSAVLSIKIVQAAALRPKVPVVQASELRRGVNLVVIVPCVLKTVGKVLVPKVGDKFIVSSDTVGPDGVAVFGKDSFGAPINGILPLHAISIEKPPASPGAPPPSGIGVPPGKTLP